MRVKLNCWLLGYIKTILLCLEDQHKELPLKISNLAQIAKSSLHNQCEHQAMHLGTILKGLSSHGLLKTIIKKIIAEKLQILLKIIIVQQVQT